MRLFAENFRFLIFWCANYQKSKKFFSTDMISVLKYISNLLITLISPVARSPVTRSPVSRSPVNRSPMTNRKRDEFTESVESISTQSGSYHLPSSGYTPNERSLVDSPYGFEDINVLETEIKSIDK